MDARGDPRCADEFWEAPSARRARRVPISSLPAIDKGIGVIITTGHMRPSQQCPLQGPGQPGRPQGAGSYVIG
jgi:hypothetical protein